jgi:hypothetical protein
MDQWTRRIVGFERGVVDGVPLCRMFNQATGCQTPPTYLSPDHDPLYRFYQWQANLRILNVKDIKTVPHVPLSHPFVEPMPSSVQGVSEPGLNTAPGRTTESRIRSRAFAALLGFRHGQVEE